MTAVLIRRGKLGLRHTHRGEHLVKMLMQREGDKVMMEVEVGVMLHKSKNTWACQSWKRQGRIMP